MTTTMRGGVGCVSARVRRRTAVKRWRGASRVDPSKGSRTRRFERSSMDHPLAGRPGPTRRENVRDRARLPVPSREGKSGAPRSHVPSRGAVTSKVFSSAHFFCALACSSRSVSRRAVAIVGVRPETRARKWRRQAIEPFLSVALCDRRRSLSVQIHESMRTATRKLEKRDECETLATPASARQEPDARDFPCTAWTLVSGVRGATRG